MNVFYLNISWGFRPSGFENNISVIIKTEWFMVKIYIFLYHGLIYIDRFSQVVTCYCEMFIHFIVCTALWFCRQALVKLHLVLWPGTLPCSHCSRSLYRSFLSSPLILQPGLYCKIEEKEKTSTVTNTRARSWERWIRGVLVYLFYGGWWSGSIYWWLAEAFITTLLFIYLSLRAL